MEEETYWTNPLEEEEEEDGVVDEEARVVDEGSGVTDVTSNLAVVEVLLWEEAVEVLEVSVL